ncbi:MAG: SulP family inorganic anion transporter [Francisellaceae bacterium]|jgi:sulfate permease, SulP family|nr:SulP family inorganic anion transporter [Francisellaceae bacterium]MBT6538108.1 SulP family inorganic anion transporter [Francisellaceae bacterium]
MNLDKLKSQWFDNVRGDILAGMVVALALIPEAIAFSIIAGVDPKVGLYSSFCIAVVISIVGGRPGMISAATGAMALVMVSLVKEYGLEYLLAATILTGIIQIISGWLKLGSLLRFVSNSVVLGFVNALAILIFMAQLPEFNNAGWQMYAMVAAGLIIIYGFPYITTALPSPLIAIVTLTVFSIIMDVDLRTVGDMGQLPDTLPLFLLPNVPFNMETVSIIFPYSVTLAAVGLLESLMTSVIIDDLTDTPSEKNIECQGQGIANIVAGCFGGMAGCAMIGQSVINVKSGGRGRLSCLFAGSFLLFLILVLADWVKQIPMAALVAVMIMVSIGTFNWGSLLNIRVNPKDSSLVTFVTVIVVVVSHNLALGVFVGVLMSTIFFAKKVSRLLMSKTIISEDGQHRTYKIYGQIFFASAEYFTKIFDFKEVVEKVTIDMKRSHLWDVTSVEALDKVVHKFRREGTQVEVLGLNEASATIVEKLGGYDKPDAVEIVVKD